VPWLANRNSNGWLAVLIAFLDDSGSHDARGQEQNSEILGIGGALASTEVWDLIESGWLNVLKRYQVPVFHMAECDSLHGYYHQWTRPQADSLIDELLDCFCDSPARLVCATISTRDYDEILPQLFKEEVVKHPWHAALYLCAGRILTYLRPDYSGKVGFVFDRQEEFASYAIAGFEHLQRELNDPRLGSISFDCRENQVALQVADLVASTATRAVRLEQRRSGPPEQWMERLLRTGRMEVFQVTRETLVEFVAHLMCIGAEQYPPMWNP